MGDARLCVLCRKHSASEQWRPFCSERCRNEDLARWAEGRYHVAADPAPVPDTDDPETDSSSQT
jgi:endogenous inhibitor of DNA gyrase (YacG/DUF329 family)